MAKKSLTDLLREEVEKTSELEGENDQESTAVETPPMNTQRQPSTRRSSQTKAELEATVAELQAALKKAEKEAQDKEETFADLKDALKESQQKEEELRQQITILQSELQQQKQTVETFQQKLEKLEPLKTEFDQAKTAAIQLAKANEKLTQELNTRKKENEDIKEQNHTSPERKIGRPIQKESEKPADFAKNTWLL